MGGEKQEGFQTPIKPEVTQRIFLERIACQNQAEKL
jgi:hypothetical protein